jgi:hypothetical protein
MTPILPFSEYRTIVNFVSRWRGRFYALKGTRPLVTESHPDALAQSKAFLRLGDRLLMYGCALARWGD